MGFSAVADLREAKKILSNCQMKEVDSFIYGHLSLTLWTKLLLFRAFKITFVLLRFKHFNTHPIPC